MGTVAAGFSETSLRLQSGVVTISGVLNSFVKGVGIPDHGRQELRGAVDALVDNLEVPDHRLLLHLLLLARKGGQHRQRGLGVETHHLLRRFPLSVPRDVPLNLSSRKIIEMQIFCLLSMFSNQ